MAKKPRDTYKYQFKIGNKIVHGGITDDLERREGEFKKVQRERSNLHDNLERAMELSDQRSQQLERERQATVEISAKLRGLTDEFETSGGAAVSIKRELEQALERLGRQRVELEKSQKQLTRSKEEQARLEAGQRLGRRVDEERLDEEAVPRQLRDDRDL